MKTQSKIYWISAGLFSAFAVGFVASFFKIWGRNHLLLMMVPLFFALLVVITSRRAIQVACGILGIAVVALLWRDVGSVPTYVKSEVVTMRTHLAFIMSTTQGGSDYWTRKNEALSHYLDVRLSGTRSTLGWLLVFHDLRQNGALLEREYAGLKATRATASLR